MSKPTLIQQQRDLLHRLHVLIAQRIQAEADAAARLKSEQEAVGPYATLVQTVADAEFWLAQAEETYQRHLATSEARYQQTMDKIVQTFQPKLAQIRPTFAEFTRQVDPLVPEWTDQVWGEWTPATTISPITRLGELKVGIHQDCLPLPALLSFPGRRNLLLKTVGPAKPTAVQAIQSLLLRLAAMIPPGKLRFTFIDPVGLGQNVAAFMHLPTTTKSWSPIAHGPNPTTSSSAWPTSPNTWRPSSRPTCVTSMPPSRNTTPRPAKSPSHTACS